jgi:hypothetical protein
MADVEAQDGRKGLSRRDMIKASAAAGAVAWTAPVIIDSLASPAAAASGCTGSSVTLSWIYVLYRVSGVYFITGFSKGESTCGNIPSGGGGSNTHAKTCTSGCGTGVAFTLNLFNGTPPSPAGPDATFNTSDSCAGSQSNAWTYAASGTCGTFIQFSNGQIFSQGGAVILGAVGFGAGSTRALCPNNSSPGNSVCGIEL